MMVSVPRAISKCPNCGEPVSPFAAGCAVCGTDLEAARAELAAKRARRPTLPGPIRLGDDAVRIGVGVIATVFSPVMGALLTGYFAYDADRNGRDAQPDDRAARAEPDRRVRLRPALGRADHRALTSVLDDDGHQGDREGDHTDAEGDAEIGGPGEVRDERHDREDGN